MDNKLREIDLEDIVTFLNTPKVVGLPKETALKLVDTIKRLTEENEIVRQALENVKGKLSEAWQERDGARSLLRQKEEENKRLQSLIRPPSLRD